MMCRWRCGSDLNGVTSSRFVQVMTKTMLSNYVPPEPQKYLIELNTCQTHLFRNSFNLWLNKLFTFHPFVSQLYADDSRRTNSQAKNNCENLITPVIYKFNTNRRGCQLGSSYLYKNRLRCLNNPNRSFVPTCANQVEHFCDKNNKLIFANYASK
jgi:hypothetical protein